MIRLTSKSAQNRIKYNKNLKKIYDQIKKTMKTIKLMKKNCMFPFINIVVLSLFFVPPRKRGIEQNEKER